MSIKNANNEDESIKANGTTCVGTKQIIVCRYLNTNCHYAIESYQLVMLHEIAHAISPASEGHGDIWVSNMKYLINAQTQLTEDQKTKCYNYILAGKGSQRCASSGLRDLFF